MLGIHRNSVAYWSSVMRCCAMDIINQNETILGGENIIVEIDECVLRRRKYHRGRRKKQMWVFGAVERKKDKMDETRNFFVMIVPDRSASTLIPIIQKHILPHSTIMSDEWKAYSSLSRLGYNHLTVCHKREFNDEETHACTNTIEGLWSHMRRFFPPHGIREKYVADQLAFWMINKRKIVRFEEFVSKIVFYKEKQIEEAEEDDETVENEEEIPDLDDSIISNDSETSETDNIDPGDGLSASEYSENS
ncbi:putative Uncharacterized transposase-like protein [Monocercomonoides exilis]|uniref:putative Uncharacterized transposase-like protein n=1 Tax=Monocercomonoides exilis TaxID=2049356 RepID=UPI00355965E7|nr:putative Uncharacterized transposase-like protein [Monocercomonoides exilis]|eukprot:MONOS_4018.1-p1 / transcript=MONOS_4018.1 / gene=MONOS_4018 / organism=Monocercomonoides_exilis_PA203 / gene_product=Uncharacterized transposase-like protein HI1328.1 / transcript_product=Uncharacterized transposase-like protein HI1328.1 / location=Mono_scaffold00101:91686-92432(+) / protein_length=248 / sequence_SO=supercontig / SO=protein_coding / is_pseudo=false